MASWFGGIGSGLGQSLGQVGGSLSSFTGQLSSFTKDILAEGTEEVAGNDLYYIITVILSEVGYERLRKLYSDSEEKEAAAELQIKHLSSEYRNQLQQKDVEISHLKARQNALRDQVQKLQTAAQPTGFTSTASTSFLPVDVSTFHGDTMDFGDVIGCQQEINRLSNEVSRLEADASHWRLLAESSKGQGTVGSDENELYKLQKAIKELKQQLSQEIDEHQHELSALQDAHRQKLGELTRRHRGELEEYEERIEELEQQVQAGTGAVLPDHSKLPELQRTVKHLEDELEMSKHSAEELEKRVQSMQEELAVAEQGHVGLSQEGKSSTSESQLLLEYERLKVEREMMQNSVNELQITLEKQEEQLTEKLALEAEVLHLRQVMAEVLLAQQCIQEPSILTAEVDKLRQDLLAKENELMELSIQKDTLLTEVEELDGQNQEATQYLITLKNQLAKQRQESEEKIQQLESKLQTAINQCSEAEASKASMLGEMEAQKGKLNQSAFALNDLHMNIQQQDNNIRDLTEQLKKAQARNADLKAEGLELKGKLQNAEASVAKLELTQAVQEVPAAGSHVHLLKAKEVEISELRKEISESSRLNTELQTELHEIKIQTSKLDTERNNAIIALDEVKLHLQEAVAHNVIVSKESHTLLEALRLEKNQLEAELNRAEIRVVEEARKYEHTIEELTKARNLDATALQKEHERLIKLNQEKHFETEELKRNAEQLETDHEETKEMLKSSLESQQQLTELLKEKEIFVETLKEKSLELQQELKKTAKAFKECELLKQNLEEKDRQLSTMKEENNHLKEEMERLRDQQSRSQPTAEPKTLDIIIELETEITELNSKRNSFEEEIRVHKKTIDEQNLNLLQLQRSIQGQGKERDEAKAQYEEIISTYEKLISEKDEEIRILQESIDQIQTRFQRALPEPPAGVPVILEETKVQTVNGENGNEKHDLSKVEIDRLVNGIKEKDVEIKVLNEKNLSLTKELDQLTYLRDEVGKLTQIIQQKDLEIQTLHARVTAGPYMQQLQAYAMEREQVLAVLNEKTRENSQLKTEYHRMMDIIAAKEAALLKLQEENQKMINSYENESQDMVRETIQNLSRIIREKDIEIDALTQKCQTLVTVLQSSGMGSGGESGLVSSNQFEELLQERDKLKQQVKKMEEWKQQVITTVQNMQHESAHLHDELLKLQGRLSTDGDCNSRLQIDYNRLIQSYEQKERRLQSLSRELAEVQQSIGQLSTTKELILERLDGASPEPQIVGATIADVLNIPVVSSGLPSKEQLDQMTKLHQEMERLNKALEQKDATVKALQDDLKLCSSQAANSESGRKEQEESALEMKLMKEKAELQKSFREKDLLIKSKSDQLASASESLRNQTIDNEVLKQAVTNLKERILIVEMEIRKQQEDNDKVVAKSCEKESEFRALQETNMELSMMLREREFESNAVKEKASALEKLLKQKEMGKSGELNQLLNEVKSMQEQAAMFQHERDQVMLALKQKQMEANALVNELQHTRDKQQRLDQELQRLRNHLLEMEDSYTKEALASEDRETELRKKVTLLGEKLMSSSSAVETASHQASLQVESLQEQLQTIARQRDEALLQLHTSQEQVKQYAMSLTNLQMVIEQFQQEEKAMYATELEKHQKDTAEWKNKAIELEDMVVDLQQHLDEANAALDSASRLTEQMDLKEEQLKELKNQGNDLFHYSQNKLMNLLNNSEGKIDKVLMRNLFVGYFHTPKNKRNEALRLVCSVLGLQKEEYSQLLNSESRAASGWMSWLGAGRGSGTQSVPTTPQRPNHNTIFNSSFSEMFVKFLETESRPSLPPPKLPVYDVNSLGPTSDINKPPGTLSRAFKRPEINPFLAPRSAAVPLINPASSSAGGSAHLLMKPISSALPTFTPLPVSSDSSAGAVLKDLLKQ
uniref:Thyroid hormone receptor interactor 11 n=1 Tax=Callorhinchus milii TaxID=7868 RepID=A0A4W3IS35_CALMI